MSSRFLLMAALLAAGSAHAFDLADGRFSVSGYGQAAVGLTDGNQSHGVGNTLDFVDPEFTLLVSARPIDELFISVQAAFSPGGVELDWAFFEWRFSDLLRVRVGAVKQPFGLLGETRDVGTLRPFFHPAEAVYQESTELSTDGLIGVGLVGHLEADHGWGINYDLYAGQLRLDSNDMLDQIAGYVPYAADGSAHPITEFNTGLFGGRLWLNTPIDGLSIAASGYVSAYASDEVAKLGEPEVKIAAGPSIEYLTERWMVRAELFFLFHEHDMRRFAAYAEAGYFVTQHFQPAVRFEYSDVGLFAGPRNSSYTHHREASFALNYWFNRSAVVRLEYHLTYGNLLAHPEQFVDSFIAGSAPRLTNAVLLGSQFSF